MKTVVLLIASFIIGLLPTKAQSTNSSSSSSTAEVTVKIDSDRDQKKYYRSFAVLDMDNDYRIKVRFMKHMSSDVKAFLVDQFGKENMIVKDDTYFWSKELDEEEMYEVRLKGNKLRINLNKDLASDKLIKRFIEIGKELKSITSNSEEN